MLSFDDYLIDRIAIGKAQILTFTALSLVQFILGFEQLLSILLTTQFANFYQITLNKQSIIFFCYFISASIGNFIVFLFADRIGRKKLLFLTQLFSVVILNMNTFISSYYQVVFLIFSYGLIYGIAYPISYLLSNEIVPIQIRGRLMIILQVFNISGMLYLMILCNIFLDLGMLENIKEILKSNFIPSLLSILFLFFVEESPRFYIMKQAYKQGFALLDQLGIMNNRNYFDINLDEQQAMIKWQQDLFKGDQPKQVTISLLFQRGLYKLTLLLVTIFVIFNIIQCGIIISLPFSIQQMKTQYIDIIFAQFIQCFSLIIIYFIIDNEKYGGRIRIIQYGSLIMLIGLIIELRQTQISSQIIGIILLISGLTWSQLCLTLLPIEAYPTLQKSKGVGLIFGIGNISGSIFSLFVISLFPEHSLIIICLEITLIAFIIILSLYFPIDTTQKPLDYYFTKNSYYLSESGSFNSRKNIPQQSRKEYSLQGHDEIIRLPIN